MAGVDPRRLVPRPPRQTGDILVDDEDYAPLHKDSARGRPSIPPSLVVLAMLLQYHDDCSDAEAEQRMRFDLGWRRALGMGLEDGGFDSTVLCRFRRRLLDRGLERPLFERPVNAARGELKELCLGGRRKWGPREAPGSPLSVSEG